MNEFEGYAVNDEGHLEIGGCDATRLVEEYGTPLYIMNEELIRSRCRDYTALFDGEARLKGGIYYAAKAFLTRDMCAIIESEGLGLDVVSGGELFVALQAGFPPERISFNALNKSQKELEMALEVGVGRMVVNSTDELRRLERIARRMDCAADLLLRLTPGIEAHTHEYIRTGQEDSKFGLSIAGGKALAVTRDILVSRHLNLRGYHCHIGSQIFNLDSYRAALTVMVEFIAGIRGETGYQAQELNLGGGIGIQYTRDDPKVDIGRFGQMISEELSSLCTRYDLEKPHIFFEPGRSIAGPAGTTLYRVGVKKHLSHLGKTYLIVDGGMTDNIRPPLYGACYEAAAVNCLSCETQERVTVAGRCCESGDILIEDILLAPVDVGDVIAVFATGAYNYSMASNYNMLRRPPVILVRNGESRLSVRRQTFEDLLCGDQFSLG